MGSGGGTTDKTWFLFAHGAGAPSTSPWMKRYASYLEQFGPVRSFDYPYMKAGKKRPDPQPKLLEAHQAELHAGRKIHGNKVVLIGKSMGGRMGCHLAVQEQVHAVICLGYPLKGMGKSGALRSQVLLDLNAPTLFVQGTRDALCPLDLLRDVLRERRARSELHVVETGDHSLTPTKTHLKAAGLSEAEVERDTMRVIGSFLRSVDDASIDEGTLSRA